MYDRNGGDCDAPEVFLGEQTGDENVLRYAAELVASSLERLADIDSILEKHVRNYTLSRVSCVERSVLRLAVGELLQGATPYRVVIDEALHLAKHFGGKDSKAFVNGVLDPIAKEHAA